MDRGDRLAHPDLFEVGHFDDFSRADEIDGLPLPVGVLVQAISFTHWNLKQRRGHVVGEPIALNIEFVVVLEFTIAYVPEAQSPTSERVVFEQLNPGCLDVADGVVDRIGYLAKFIEAQESVVTPIVK